MLQGWGCAGRESIPQGNIQSGPTLADLAHVQNTIEAVRQTFHQKMQTMEGQISRMQFTIDALQQASAADARATVTDTGPAPREMSPAFSYEMLSTQRDQSERLSMLEKSWQLMQNQLKTELDLDLKDKVDELDLNLRAKVDRIAAKMEEKETKEPNRLLEEPIDGRDLTDVKDVVSQLRKVWAQTQNRSWFQSVHDELTSMKNDITLQNRDISDLKLKALETQAPANESSITLSSVKLATQENGSQLDCSESQEQQEVLTALQDTGETEVHQSVWSLILFVGTPAFGTGGSITAIMLLLVNLAVTCIFSIVCLLSFTTNPFDDDALAAATDFRINIAHDNRHKNTVTGKSLASDVCSTSGSLLVAAEQTSMLGDSRSYLGEYPLQKIFGGPLMCFLALLCWFFTVSKELFDILRFYVTFCQLPHEKGKTLLVETDEGIELKSITWNRFALVSITCLFRAAMALWLIFVGSLFLAYTITASDLLLNAVALEFIITLQYLIFDALAPVCARTLLAKLKPLPVEIPPLNSGCDPLSWIITIGVFGGVAIFWSVFNADMVANMRQYDVELCNGNTDFTFAKDGLEVAYIVATSAPNDTRDTILMTAVKEAIDSDSLDDTVYSLDPSTFSVTIDTVATYDVSQSVEMYNSPCMDNLVFKMHPTVELARYLFKDPSFPTLEESEKPCANVNYDLHCTADAAIGAYARGACPETCGCTHVLSPQALRNARAGCPVSCSDTPPYLSSLNALNCTDRTKAELDQADYWQSWTHELIRRNNEFSEFGYGMRQAGCNFLNFAATKGPLLKTMLCNGRTLALIPPISPVCPVTCKCGEDPLIDLCPSTC